MYNEIEVMAAFPDGKWNEVVLFKGTVYQYLWVPGKQTYTGCHVWTKINVREVV
tara:strand:- start:254 stop:415 length:162 start_codon:yes stop_codon:yes gene_type:complete